MDWLNYHHLLYFWVVAREGSISKACDQLHLSQPTISSQLKKLEQSFGQDLFTRSGRQLQLTEAGHVAFQYADEIFSLGRELTDTLKGRITGRPLRLTVGVTDVLSKLIAYRLLEPALHLPEPVRLVCREGKLSQLLADLANHQLDVVLSDSPVGSGIAIRAYNHFLGECPVAFYGVEALAARFQPDFPDSLEDTPLLLPTPDSLIRRYLDLWFDERDMRPEIVCEFEDSALLKVFGQAGVGLFPSPSAIETEVCSQYGVSVLGRIPEVKEQFYAISVERRLEHPAVVAISTAAREELFS